MDNNVKNKFALRNYTKGAVKIFEKNIVSQKDYLEKIKKNKCKRQKISV